LNAQAFLHRDGKKIVNGAGEEIILKGIGLSGWMLQEPYLLDFPANAQNQIKSKIEALIGKENTDTFYYNYLANCVREKDIDSLALWGFNSVRLPMHYNLFITSGDSNLFIDKGFAMVDSLLAWCTKKHIYLILDLHAAPGGQGNDTAISDVVKGKPLLWQSSANKLKAVMLWRKLAERYKNQEWIGGYDLINEPNYSFTGPGEGIMDLKSLYVRITDTIRAVDTTHILFIEGNSFATDFSKLTPPWDSNMVYSFHKYWNTNLQSDLNTYNSLRNSYNVPLWLGESGENSNTWYADCINLVQNINKIGWAWWPIKKFGCNGIMTVTKPKDYQTLLDYFNNKASKPDTSFAVDALAQLTENFKIENCKINHDVIQAMMELPGSTETKPYKELVVPGTIFASDYDIGRNTYAYYDVKSQTTVYGDWGGNEGGIYRNDGVGIEKCQDISDTTNSYDVGWTEATDWMNYTFNCTQTGFYNVQIRIAGQNGGTVNLKIDGITFASNISIPVTGGWQNWQTLSVNGTEINSGKHVLQIYIVGSGFNLSYIKIIAGIDKIKNAKSGNNELIIYPNPAKEVLYLENPDNITVSANINICDLTGRTLKVFRNQSLQKEAYNIGDLAPGEYFLSALLSNRTFIKSFMKR